MCRFAAYLGPSAPLSTLFDDPPHGLSEQARAPRQQDPDDVNVDGTGVVWWRDGDPAPLRYVSTQPPWSDPNLPELARRLNGVSQLAAVRNATAGIPHGPANVAPFLLPPGTHHGPLAVAHNGWIGGYRGGVGRALTEQLPDDLWGLIDAVSDSLGLALSILRHLRAEPAVGLAGAVRRAVAEVSALCKAAGREAVLTFVVTDGTRAVATRAATGASSNSLYTLRGGARWPHAVLLASEPLDDDSFWQPVPDATLVEITTGSVTMNNLDEHLQPGEAEEALAAERFGQAGRPGR